MSDVVVRKANNSIDIGDILIQHRDAIIVCVGIVVGVTGTTAAVIITRVGDKVVVRDHVHVDGDVAFVNAVDTVHDQNFSGQRACDGVITNRNRIFVGAG